MHQCPNTLSPFPPSFSGNPELLVRMFIHKAGEEALGIDQDATEGTEEITKPLIVMDLQ